MPLPWSSITFTPSSDAVHELHASWGWLIAEPFKPVLFSSMGDVFVEKESGDVWWLNTGVGELTRVAESVPAFQALLNTDLVMEWFLPGLVEQLHSAGKIPAQGECFTFVTLPVFSQGKYEVSNLNPVPAREHFAITGHIIREIHGLPDGAQVRITVED